MGGIMSNRRQRFWSVLATIAIAASPAGTGGQNVKASAPVSPTERASELHQKALDIYATNRAFDAAQLHLAAARLRAPNDAKGVDCLALAAHMFNYANRPLDAKRTMERAAERALAIGDVLRGAQALVDAAFMADKQKNKVEVTRLGRKALLLAESPLLSSEERLTITKRINGNPGLAQAIK
jgi:hypothetical protein